MIKRDFNVLFDLVFTFVKNKSKGSNYILRFILL